jgi:hypothetical protein
MVMRSLTRPFVSARRMAMVVAIGCLGVGMAGCSSSPGSNNSGATTTSITSAVGSTSTSTSTTAPVNVVACSLFSQGDAQEALAEAVALVPNSDKADCDYAATSGDGNELNVSITATTDTPAEFTARYCPSGGGISGLGDAACGGSNNVVVLKGSLIIAIQPGLADVLGNGAYLENFQTLAAKIVAAL